MKTKATNAVEAKILVDKYLNWLSPKRCASLFRQDICLGVLSSDISYRIGSSAYYYGIECKQLCSEVIRLHIINGCISNNYKRIKETV